MGGSIRFGGWRGIAVFVSENRESHERKSRWCDAQQENWGQENESQMDEGLCRLFSCRTCPSLRLKILARLQEINR